MRQKLTFDDVCEMLSQGGYVDPNTVRADAMQRKVWIAEWHIPGCLSESQTLCFTKRGAIAAALDMASDENGPPRGMRADLQRCGRSDKVSAGAYVNVAVTTVSQHRIADII